MTFEDQQRLNGWHAAQNAEPFNFLMPKEWQAGWLLWSDTQVVQRLCHQHAQQIAFSAQVSLRKSPRT